MEGDPLPYYYYSKTAHCFSVSHLPKPKATAYM